MAKRDYYDVLGVPRDANEGEIKRAFRELARRYHPDVNADDTAAEGRFKEINEAYAVLSDERARGRYDRYGHDAAQRPAAPSTGFGTVVDAVDDLIGDILKRRRERKRGSDLRYTLELTVKEAALGCSKTIRVPDHKGTEQIFTVAIPGATEEGAVKTLRGEGAPGKAGGTAGDLHVHIRIRDDGVFRIEGRDIWCELPISFPQAALGAVIEVPTIEGPVRMRIPEGTQSGAVFRIRGKGGATRTSRGDQLVRVIVETPRALSQQQRELLERFAADGGDPIVHPSRARFLDKVKGFLS